MRKTFTMTRLDDKETSGCYRYAFTDGDSGIASIYLRKESVNERPAQRIQVKITEED